MQAGNITTNSNVRMEFNLPELIAKKTMTINCHVNDSAKGIYDIILGRDLLTELGLNLKFSNHVIEGNYVNFKVYTASLVDLGAY